jgi:drug/metabolite transporter (DMT)-like permease
MASASVALVAIFGKELKKVDKGALLGGSLLGVFLWAGYSFQTVGLKMTTPSKSAFITGMAVVLVPFIVAITGRRLPNRWTLLGVACAFSGLYLMTIPKTEGFSLTGINVGDLITLGCPISFALHIYTLGRLMQRYPFKVISVLQVVVATLLMGITIPLETPHLAFTGQAVFAILFTGLICTAAAFSIQAWAQQFTPPTHTALIFVLEPVFAALTSYVLLGEHLGARGTVGAMLILGGILFSELKGSSAEPNPGTRPTEGENLAAGRC